MVGNSIVAPKYADAFQLQVVDKVVEDGDEYEHQITETNFKGIKRSTSQKAWSLNSLKGMVARRKMRS